MRLCMAVLAPAAPGVVKRRWGDGITARVDVHLAPFREMLQVRLMTTLDFVDDH